MNPVVSRRESVTIRINKNPLFTFTHRFRKVQHFASARTMSKSPMLLQNGTVLLHDANNHVIPTQTSVLIEDGRISKIGHNISVDDIETIDCTDKIISPGFINTHSHGWQTQLKGQFANHLIMEYMVKGNAQSVQYTPEDVFYGQLSGMLEMIASGTTTVVDHAHMTMSPAHVEHAIAGTVSSGIRSVFCYCPIMRIKNFNPLTYHPNPMEDWVMETFQELAAEGPWGNDRVTLGFAWDFYFLPDEVTRQVFRTVHDAGVKTITSHYADRPQVGGGMASLPSRLKKLDLLDHKILFSHANGAPSDDILLLREAGAHISSTPSTELQMSIGRPLCFDATFLDGGPRKDEAGAQDCASLGIDCHSYTTGSIVYESRLALATARSQYNDHHMAKGKSTLKLPDGLSVEAAFNLATIKGAEAANMENEIGRIAEGYKADLVIFDALSPALVAAAQHDPVVAVIMHSSPADIEMVIVDGVVRKQASRLVDVQIEGEEIRDEIRKSTLTWNEIAKKVIEGRSAIQKKIDAVDFKEAEMSLRKLYQIDEGIFV